MLKTLTGGRNRFLIIVPVLVLLVFMAAGGSSCGTRGEPAFSKSMQGQLDKVLTGAMAKYGIPGAIVGLWVPGKGQWVVARGKADVKTGKAPGVTDKVRMGSISKSVTATVVLQLADEGKLGLDDKLSRYEAWVPNAEGIAVRQLLNMTSGLYNYTDDSTFWDKLMRNPTTPWTPRELVDIALAHPPAFPPGQGYKYCNTNYILLGMIIEKVSGRTAGEEITTRVIDKLGLKNSSFPDGPDIPTPHMNGYMSLTDNSATDINKLADVSVMTPTGYWTAGAVISNLDDMKVWAKALADGSLISKEMQKHRLTFMPEDNPQYGLGIMTASGTGFVGHSGEVLGFNCSMYCDAASGNTVIVLLNRYPSQVEGVSDLVAFTLLETAGAVKLP